MRATPPPSPLRVIVTVLWVVTKTAVTTPWQVLVSRIRPRQTHSGRRRFAHHEASATHARSGLRRIVSSHSAILSWTLLSAIARRLILLGALLALAFAGGDLLAARPTTLVPPLPEVFLIGFALCGAICLVAPERRLRWSSLAVGSAHGMLAALTFFGSA